jgi:hypothetical protein
VPHWRSFLDSEVIRYADLAERGDITLEIAKVVKGKVTGKSGKGSSKAMISFKGAERPLAAGTAILSSIAKLYGKNTDKWVGKLVTLYADDEVMFGGERVGGVRCRPVVPASSSAGEDKK